MAMTLLALPQAPVWVLDDRGGENGGHPMALAGRLGLPFLRMPGGAAWRAGGAANRAWALGDRDHGPRIVLSSGMRGAARALALRARHGSTLIHCTPHPMRAMPFDLLVTTGPARAADAGRTVRALGPLHVVSTALLAQARTRWAERLSHLPRPHVALLARNDGRLLDARRVREVASLLSRTVSERGGTVLASLSPTIGTASLGAIEAALKPGLHLLYRTGEPGEDPTLGFLGTADAVLVLGGSEAGLSEAAAADAPVFGALLDHGSPGARRLARSLAEEGRIRGFSGHVSPWPRTPLDEAGRVAAAIRARLGLDPGGAGAGADPRRG